MNKTAVALADKIYQLVLCFIDFTIFYVSFKIILFSFDVLVVTTHRVRDANASTVCITRNIYKYAIH